MSKPRKDKPETLRISSEVAREIRQHARSSSKTEVCGVLIGRESDGVTMIEASIAGTNAEQGGAHVTFTQDTWEHIYQVKDRDYPEKRIVGWYHSHPGFGVFLSDHDTFIHKNFFSSPQQVAWVYDPHSDEEGCFGWRGDRIERLAQFGFTDSRGGEPAGGDDRTHSQAANVAAVENLESEGRRQSTSGEDPDLTRLARIVSSVFSHLAIFLLGGVLIWYLFPRILLMPIPVDPQTGRPLPGLSEAPTAKPLAPGPTSQQNNQNRTPDSSDQTKSGETKRDDAHK
jgi:proteasome lid subunit RPN8/RPN11